MCGDSIECAPTTTKKLILNNNSFMNCEYKIREWREYLPLKIHTDCSKPKPYVLYMGWCEYVCLYLESFSLSYGHWHAYTHNQLSILLTCLCETVLSEPIKIEIGCVRMQRCFIYILLFWLLARCLPASCLYDDCYCVAVVAAVLNNKLLLFGSKCEWARTASVCLWRALAHWKMIIERAPIKKNK